jgi:hypothetical protein
MYVCYRAADGIVVDGRIDGEEWAAAPWSATFVDIEGDDRPAPALETRMRMLWDDDHLYVAARLEEPHLWGTLLERDAVIYRDDDFELFLDPDGDTHDYYELEINVLGTVWDLMLDRPYRDGGSADNGWDVAGLRTAVVADGTVNDPGDTDRGWTVELALPWGAFAETALPGAEPGSTAAGHPPAPGAYWRVNFSRVDWPMDVSGTGYVKRTAPGSERPLPESNWVWAPQGAVNMHMPEMWGYLLFAGQRAEVGAGAAPYGIAPAPPAPPAHEAVKWALRQVYYAQRVRRSAGAGDQTALSGPGTVRVRVPGHPTVRIRAVEEDDGWRAWAPGPSGQARWHIGSDGRVWREPPW